MLNIVRCGFSNSARESFYERIGELVLNGKKAYLIVPEQQTVLTEGVLSERLPASSALLFEVTNFTRLANTTFRSLGGLSGEYCDSVKKSLIMWRALTELSPTLTLTGARGEVTPGLVESSLVAVSEMQSLGISPDDLSYSATLDGVKSDNRQTAFRQLSTTNVV